jgi:hypothetical protein
MWPGDTTGLLPAEPTRSSWKRDAVVPEKSTSVATVGVSAH